MSISTLYITDIAAIARSGSLDRSLRARADELAEVHARLQGLQAKLRRWPHGSHFLTSSRGVEASARLIELRADVDRRTRDVATLLSNQVLRDVEIEAILRLQPDAALEHAVADLLGVLEAEAAREQARQAADKARREAEARWAAEQAFRKQAEKMARRKQEEETRLEQLREEEARRQAEGRRQAEENARREAEEQARRLEMEMQLEQLHAEEARKRFAEVQEVSRRAADARRQAEEAHVVAQRAADARTQAEEVAKRTQRVVVASLGALLLLLIVIAIGRASCSSSHHSGDHIPAASIRDTRLS